MSLSRPRSLLISIAVALVFALIAQPSPAATTAALTVGGPSRTAAIPAGFLGLSLEYWAIPAYVGTDPSDINPVFVRLIRNLSGGNPPELRIGGDTTDVTWWPVAHTPTPAGVTYTLTPRWIAATHALAAATRARLTLGINLEADSATVAATEADRLLAGIGRKRIAAFELGNEPELYGTFTWGRSGEPGRARDYDFDAFGNDFTRIAAALPRVPLAGPAAGGPRWFAHMGQFLADHRHVTVATVHRYPLESCYVRPPDPHYPTIAHMLSRASTQALSDSVAAAVRAAHARHVPIRVDEINTVSCGWDPAVSRSFASALWALETSFDLARVGVDGIDFHTFPGATYALFAFDHLHSKWRGVVMPEYYGLQMFAQAAPAGSRLLSVSAARTGHLRTYATRDPSGTIRVVVINKGSRARLVDVRALAATGTGRVELLTAHGGIRATTGVTLGGQSYGRSTTTGTLAGARKTKAVAPTQGEYVLRVPPAAAAMLTLPSDGGAALAGNPPPTR